MRDIVVSNHCFSLEEVMERGQEVYVDWILHSGATGIEIRKEMIRSASELELLSQKLRETNLKVYYATNQPIWRIDGTLNAGVIESVLVEAELLGARGVTFSLGHYQNIDQVVNDLRELQRRFDVRWFVRNEPMELGGSTLRLKSFLDDCLENSMAMSLAFDTGYWNFDHEDLTIVHQTFAPYIRAVNVRGMDEVLGQHVIRPIEDDPLALWKQTIVEFPNAVVGFEFPIQTANDLREYVEKIRQIDAMLQF